MDNSFRFIANKPRLKIILVGLMLVITVGILWYSIRQAIAPPGSTDLHSYWYHGHFVLLGENPYRAFFDDLIIPGMPEAQSGLANTPANTAPLVLVLSALSWLSWPEAKLAWLILNLSFSLLIPLLTVKLLPHPNTLSRFQKLSVFFVFLILQGTRIATWVGQTTLLVFLLMLGTLLLRGEHKVLAGILLGFALSKYSLAGAVFLFLLLKRDYFVLLLSLVVQVIGLGIVSLLGNHSPLLTVEYYLRMIGHHNTLPGIHLASLFPTNNMVTILLAFLGTLVLGAYLWWIGGRLRTAVAKSEKPLSFADWHLLSILLLWSLLVVYHRAYDTLLVIIFIVTLSYGLTRPNQWQISAKTRQGLGLFLLLFIGMMSIPSSVMSIVFPVSFMPTWYQWVSHAMTLTLIAAACLTAWLYARVVPEALPSATAAPS